MATVYVRAPNPIWIFRDLAGNPLDDTYYISFLTNTLPYLPQLVYRDNQGLVPWSDPLELTPYGGLPPNVYFDPTLVYRLEIRQGPLQSNQLIYEVNDFVPSEGGSTPSTTSGTEDNMITNSQFSQIDFVSPLSISVAGTYDVAPGWELVLTGSGTATVTQLIFTGAQNLSDSPVPPYALRIATNGWTTAILRQRFNGVGAIWSNTFVSMSVLARSSNGVANSISLVYAPNTPGTPVLITQGTLSTGSYEYIQGVIALPESTDTTLNNAAYVDMEIILPPVAGSVDISNIQVMGQTELLPVNFSQTPDETIERQIDHFFHIYANELIIKPKNTILTAWNFGLNPNQITFTGAPNVPGTTPLYVTDQTIVKTQAADSVTFQLSTSPYGAAQIQARHGVTQGQVSMIQYIDPLTMRGFWGCKVSSLVRAYVDAVSGTDVKIKMRLIYRDDLPPSLGAAEPIASFSGGDPVFAAGWTALTPKNDPAYVVTAAIDPTQNAAVGMPFSFDAFALPSQTNAAATLGIVLYTVGNLSNTADQKLFINTVSLVPNLFACDSSPQTFDQCLAQCQYYYEHSYNVAQVPGTGLVTAVGQRYNAQTMSGLAAPSASMMYENFELKYQQFKRAIPTITFYSPTDPTADQVLAQILRDGTNPTVSGGSPHTNPFLAPITAWTENVYLGSALYVPTNTSTAQIVTSGGGAQGDNAMILYQYEADARLGI